MGQKDISFETAEIIRQIVKVPMTVIDALKECAWGMYEGHPVQSELLDKWLGGGPGMLSNPPMFLKQEF